MDKADRSFGLLCRFIRDFESKINPLKLVEIAKVVSRQIEGQLRLPPPSASPFELS
jgi:hypothetical protein